MSQNTAMGSMSNSNHLIRHIQEGGNLSPETFPVNRGPLRKSDALCGICKHLTLHYLENEDGGDAPCPFGLSVPTNHVKRNAQNCPVCRLLARYCFARYGAQPSDYDSECSVDLQSNLDLMGRLSADERFEVDGDQRGRRLSVTMLPEHGEYTTNDIGPTFHIFPVGATQLERNAFGCRLIDPYRIDLSIVNFWLSRCENKHESSCGNIRWMRTKEDQVFWTIDVRNKCLRRTCGKDRFIALSYVLGVFPFVATAEEFFALVDKEASLQDKFDKLPKTVADAVVVVLEIGETLLWVDALCIPPSAKHRAAQIAHMDQIYGAAALTIVAANRCNTDVGLFGVRPGLILAVELPHTIEAVSKAPWNNRGWTYQEQLLSKRLLIFADETVFWQCKSMLAGEDGGVLADKNQTRVWWQGLKLSADRPLSSEGVECIRQFRMQGDELFDDSYFWEYTDVVEEYSKRNITLDSDVLAAFSGLSRGFAWAWKTDLLWGLPEHRIDAALLWVKDLLSDRNPHSLRRKPTSVRFPSWTWAGWKGAVRYERGVFDSTGLEYTRPCVGWFALKNGKLSLLGPPYSSQIPQAPVEDPGLRCRHDVDDDHLCLKMMSLKHELPTDFCFTNQMLYGYTTVAPMVNFVEFWTGTNGKRFVKPSRSTVHTVRGRELGKFVQFRNSAGQITGGAQLNSDCDYEADEVDLILLCERRRIDKHKNQDVSLGYRVMLVKWDRSGRTAIRVGLGRIGQHAWWDASPTWRKVILT